ncbi:hypothetical protein CNR22_12075 [Sphingobacteriaceae bacterium]|nr:hypothetical protein CNR22_12075 [Sphingobacteriaceae bacterium]
MESTTQVVILIAVAALAFVCLFLGMIAFLNVHRKKMLVLEQAKQLEIFKAAGEAEDKEKERIAANLHDQILGDLTGIIRKLETKSKVLSEAGANGEVFKEELLSIRAVYNDVRDISHDLVPSAVLHHGLLTALQHKVESMRSANSALINFKNASDFTDNLPFDIREQLNIFRIVLEVLNNLNKHSNFGTLLVLTENTDTDFIISCIHNGKGVTDEEMEVHSATSNGLGLKSLKKRAMLLNAKILYFVEDGLSNVLVKIPLKQ